MPTDGPTKIREYHEQLSVDLTRDEFDDRANKLAQVTYDLTAHYAHEDEVKKQLKSVEAELESKRAALSSIVKNRAEPRTVMVQIWADYRLGSLRKMRLDTGEVLSERALTDDERQAALFEEERKEKAEAEKAPKRARKLKAVDDDALAQDTNGEAD